MRKHQQQREEFSGSFAKSNSTWWLVEKTQPRRE